MVAANQRGVLAKVAAEIAKAGSNIDNVTVEGEGAYTAMHFILQVSNRSHLAQVMRGVRRIREIIRITREKS
jgi:GTP pyrophosphokinase